MVCRCAASFDENVFQELVMNFQKLLIAISAIVLIAAFALISGCSNENGPVQSLAEAQVDNPDPNQTENGGEVEPPVVGRIGANINIAWPFPGDDPSEWRFGRNQERTGGGNIYACGRSMNSHSGADYYARDMSRYDGYSYGRGVYAGISGRVVKASWAGGYGYSVVIYDASRHVAVRYAHLIGFGLVRLGTWVTAGQYIGMLGDSGNAGGTPHLHIVAYENVPNNGPNGWLPSCCSSTWYACRINSW
ncbi:MAG: M23 family metallopeptidase [bacterium]|nr:M23 family metallopeptidase [bacterium]